MYKMYFLVLYNLSPIQQGIQSLHACVEYSNQFWKTTAYKQWANNDKTVILLNGWSSWLMAEGRCVLEEFNIPYATFQEPDFENLTTAIAFIIKDGDPYEKYFRWLFKFA